MLVVWQVYCRRPLSHDAVGIELRVQDRFLTASSYGLCLPPSTDAQGPSVELLDCGGGLKIFVMHLLTRIVWMYLNSRVNWTELVDGPVHINRGRWMSTRQFVCNDSKTRSIGCFLELSFWTWKPFDTCPVYEHFLCAKQVQWGRYTWSCPSEKEREWRS